LNLIIYGLIKEKIKMIGKCANSKNLADRKAFKKTACIAAGAAIFLSANGAQVQANPPTSQNAQTPFEASITMRPPGDGGGGTVPQVTSPSTKISQGISALEHEKRKGTWYTWGGGHGRHPSATRGSDGHVGFDCSGLSRWFVYKATGRDLLGSGTASSQLAKARSLGATRISASHWLKNRKAGDILFYGRSHIHHVSIYVGNGYIIEAPHPGARVRKVRFYKGDFSVAMRIPFR
jgi:cell wall-associated NlpC family hydrolase